MIFNYLGEKKYRQGMDTYFTLYDSQAVTCEDFLKSLSLGSKENLDIFNLLSHIIPVPGLCCHL